MDAMIESFAALFVRALANLTDTAAGYAPRLLLGLILLLAGWGIGRLLELVTRVALRRVGIDTLLARLRLTGGLAAAGIEGAPSELAGRAAFVITLLVFLLAAVEAFGVQALSSSLDRLVAYLPSVFAGALILVIGYFAAGFSRNIVRSTAAAGGIDQADRLGVVAHRLVAALFVLVAAEQLGLEAGVLVGVLALALGVLAVSFGAAFALGAAPVARHILAGHFLRRSLALGSAVTIQGRRGFVEDVGPTETRFKSDDQVWTVPNALLLEEVAIR